MTREKGGAKRSIETIEEWVARQIAIAPPVSEESRRRFLAHLYDMRERQARTTALPDTEDDE